MIALAFALALISQDIPDVCRAPEGEAPDWAACAQALPDGSPQQTFARLNQATEAYLDRDYGDAGRVFDRAGDFGPFESDALYVFRADTRQHLGRDKEATADAEAAWRIMQIGQALEPSPDEQAALEAQRLFLLSLVLPILKEGRSSAFEPAFAAYRAIPVKDVEGYATQALVLEQLGDLDGALAASLLVVKAEPANAGYLNNHCYILVRAGRPAEGLPFCEKAVQSEPELAPLRHSLASALAGAGRCTEAETALAEARRLEPATVLYQQSIACRAR
ncbi:tetratricopeptide (TPR) repeat protein [Brevundimonas alba]|uniref:Tetratricopeptide (TPR) repeat protein n=1 Tax=Brevundimonas alba TaxID=74314 RepID=A0A7X5YIM1_9CAUL|nr:hypothetical protein [Brevundimonas alba]NJC40453.1 tetratricopeptide (TPR) repeat protein [Brevundimonas alba]